MPREVILALVLVDLPVDLDNTDGVRVRDGHGGSWWFLTCECDDHAIDVVEEVVSICSYAHLRELCFMKGDQHGSAGTVMSRATPGCERILRRSLRFVGRFEFLGGSAIYRDDTAGLKVFDALDFGDEDDIEDGQRVLLRCYDNEANYMAETAVLQEDGLDLAFVEGSFEFTVQEDDKSMPEQFCLAIERPSMTLNRVVEGMRQNSDYQRNDEMRARYMSKISMVLRTTAKCVRHMHQRGIIHGNLCLESCGKFGESWKVADVIGSRKEGEAFGASRFGESSPPEAVELMNVMVESYRDSARKRPTFVSELEASVAIDVWGFGKLAFEAFTGLSLIDFDEEKEVRNDSRSLLRLLRWNDKDLHDVIDCLREAGISTLGADLISFCLLPNPRERPNSMDDILNHPFWKDMRRKTAAASSSSTRSNRSRRTECESDSRHEI